MNCGIDLKGTSMLTVRALLLALAGLCALAAGAQAAPVPAPALKVLAVTGPTNLPPKQSETQRVTVEAEGGNFTLGVGVGEGKVTPVTTEGTVASTEGSPVLTIEAGSFEVGARVLGAGLPFGENFVISCSTDCQTPGSTVTMSAPAEYTSSGEFALISPKEATVVEGEFPVGAELQATGAEEIFLPGTVVTSVSGSTISLSKPPSFLCIFCENVDVAATQKTAPIAYDASATAMQSALETVLGAGSVTVGGGPGGDAGHPYFITFDGSLPEQDVQQVEADSGLTGEHPFVHVFTTVPGGNGTGEIAIFPANVGGEPSSGVVTAHLGPLPDGIVMSGPPHSNSWSCNGDAGDIEATCTTSETMRVFHSAPRTIVVPIEVEAGASPRSSTEVELSGGGSAPDVYQMPIVVSKQPAPFGVAAAWAGSFEADGSPSTQAGGHPFASAAYILLNSRRNGGGEITPSGDSKSVGVDLPPGFTGNPLAGKRCPQSVVLPGAGSSKVCTAEMTVGNLDPYIGELAESLPFESRLYNDIPPKGFAAEFTTRLGLPLQSVVAGVNSEEDFGIRLTGPNNPNIDKIYGVYTAFEGVPKFGNGQALLTNPVNCAESAQNAPLVRAKANSFQEPDNFATFVVPQPALTGCENLKFEAKDPATGKGQVGFSFQPTSTQGSTPVGVLNHLHIDQPGLTDPNGLVTPELKDSTIRFPEGMNLNPSSANGLEACSEAQIGYLGKGFPMPNPIRFKNAQPTCPDASKLGTAEIKTPLLDNPLQGALYLAAQEENPFGSLIAVYLVVNDPLTGVIIKLPGEVTPDPVTGQLTVTFQNNPQLPFEDLILNIRGGGPRSQFATPEVCGTYNTTGTWTPWSAPESGPPAQTTDSFTVSSGCSSSAAARPFAPSFEAGTTAPKAGAYAPLVIKINRNDGEQELSRFDFTLPKGLIGKLAGIPYCTESAIAAAEAKTGKAEQAGSSCPVASRLGSVDTAAGVGSEPVHVGGNVYLAGPYKGAPISAVVVTPGIAGPFDLGNVVVRAPLYIDPESAQLTTRSDPIPTILKGIPLKVRSVAITIDRPGFILNPTSCEVKSATASITGGSGATATPSNRFQVGGCADLAFTPKLSLSLKGGTKRSGNPALTAVLNQPAGQAGTGKVSVALPHSEFLDQSHIRTVCTRVQFSAHACPSGAIYGEAEAITPLLDSPLRGPVYLRSSTNKLPDLVVALRGPDSQPIEVTLAGRIDSVNGGIRNSFELVPDAPVSKFVLRMQGGKKGLLVNSTDICLKTNRATVKFEGQNGKLSSSSPPLKGQCGSQRKKHKKNKAHQRRSRSKRLAAG